MKVSYNPLFKILIDRNLKKTEFAEKIGLSSATLAKLSKGQSISMDKLIEICDYLDCTFDDVVEIIPKEKRNN